MGCNSVVTEVNNTPLCIWKLLRVNGASQEMLVVKNLPANAGDVGLIPG